MQPRIEVSQHDQAFGILACSVQLELERQQDKHAWRTGRALRRRKTQNEMCTSAQRSGDKARNVATTRMLIQ